MKKSQVAIILAALAVLAIMAFVFGGGDSSSDKSQGSAPTGAPEGSLKVTFAYSPEKAKLINPLIRSFNASGETVSGKRVYVQGVEMASGDAESKIARGKLRPTAWSPASSLWGRLLNYEADRPYTADENPSIVRTPLVIGMWEPMARKLGYPKKPISYDDILKLSTSGAGWGSYGRPEWGKFKLVHTNPDFSTAGLSAVVAEYYAATGKKEGLQSRDITGAARKKVAGIEQSIVHYGDTTLFIAEQMRRKGMSYASAAAMEEVTLLDYNRTRGRQDKLVAVYPEDGTFYSDNPYMVLDAPWVSAAAKRGAQAFGKYLEQKVTPEVAGRYSFRPADLKAKPEGPVTKANGVDPAQPRRVLGLPEPRVLATIKKNWREDRKPANVLLVVDTSGSMNDENRLAGAKDGLQVFFKQVQPQDRVGLVTFSDKLNPLVPLAPFKSNAGDLRRVVSGLTADGGTAVYDATLDGYQRVSKAADRDDRINAVVVLTDGEDTDSSATAQRVADQLRAQGDAAAQVRVFTIAYSAGADGAKQSLDAFARASGGKSYTGSTDDIETVYRSISSFF